MAAAWQLNESRGLGGSNDRVWRLSKEGDGLTIGRAAYCDIQVLSQAVEKKHSIIKWDERKGSFLIHDLGTSNGTFLNDLPLSNSVATLHHGDVLRFGYDKGHLFNVKRVEPISTSHHSSTVPNQSSSLNPLPPSSDVPLSISAQTSHQEQPLQVSGGVQYVPMATASHSPSVILPAGQPVLLPQTIYAVSHMGHVTGHVTTTAPLVTGYVSPYGSVVPASPVPSTPLHLLPSYPLTPTPLQSPTPSPSSSSSSQGLPSTQISPTFQSNTPNAHPKLDLNSRSSSLDRPGAGGDPSAHKNSPPPSHCPPQRKDGRRAVSLSSSNTPQLAEVSSLYGRPSWWVGDSNGDKEDPIVTTTKEGSPRKPAKRSEPQILRSISPPQSPTSHRPSKPIASLNTRERGEEQEKPTSTAWTVGTTTRLRRSKTIPSKWKRSVRSADSSPIRSSVGSARTKNRSVSPHEDTSTKTTTAPTSSKTRSSTPLSQRRTASNPPGSSVNTRQSRRPGSVSPSRYIPRTSSPKPSRDQKQIHKKSHSKLEIVTTESKEREREGVVVSGQALASSLSPTESTGDEYPPGGGKKTDSGLKSELLNTGLVVEKEEVVTDETYVVKSPTEGHEDRPGSARKTWNSQSQEGTLMMASIEARMKRLDKIAQNTFHSLSSLEQGDTLAGSVRNSPLPGGEGEGSDTDTHHIPEWKFFNKEVDGIIKSIRSIEKWLRDMGDTVERLRQLEIGRRQPKNETGTNTADPPVDLNPSPESEGTGFHDSIEDTGGASSN